MKIFFLLFLSIFPLVVFFDCALPLLLFDSVWHFLQKYCLLPVLKRSFHKIFLSTYFVKLQNRLHNYVWWGSVVQEFNVFTTKTWKAAAVNHVMREFISWKRHFTGNTRQCDPSAWYRPPPSNVKGISVFGVIFILILQNDTLPNRDPYLLAIHDTNNTDYLTLKPYDVLLCIRITWQNESEFKSTI